MSGGNVNPNKQLKEFIIKTFLFGEGDIKDDAPLFDSGIIDSLGFIKLLSFIENTFNITIPMSEIVMEKFSTLRDIVATIEKRSIKEK